VASADSENKDFVAPPHSVIPFNVRFNVFFKFSLATLQAGLIYRVYIYSIFGGFDFYQLALISCTCQCGGQCQCGILLSNFASIVISSIHAPQYALLLN
jgi:hypothetical protein